MLIFTDPGFKLDLQAHYPEAVCHTFADSAEAAYRQSRDVEPGTDCFLIYRSLSGDQGGREVKDHINLSYENPLIGSQDAPRFPDMSAVYPARDPNAVIAAMGDTDRLRAWPEQTVAIASGLWDAIALKHRGASLRAWVVDHSRDLNKITIQ